VVSGRGSIGTERRPIHEGQIAVLGPGDALEVRADAIQDAPNATGMDVLLLGGLPIREQIAWYGPFVMNTRDELIQAVEDYQAGRMGTIPPELSRT
jgi:redox-sensitive bicupin YhaK (pirin superfamily)